MLPIERIPDQLHIRLLRPLLGWIIKNIAIADRVTALDPVPSYAYASLVKIYAGSPIGALLARTLTEMWASPQLTRRCKLLMFAVVARGLGCEACPPEVRQALEERV